MRLFVTGSTGFIGSHFIEQALSEGLEVVALRRTPNSMPCIQLSSNPCWLDKSIEEVSAVDLKGCSAVVHFASAGVSPKEASLGDLISVNVASSARLMEMAVKAGVVRFVAAGTFAEYGTSADRYEKIPADAPLFPTYPYAASKAAAFEILHGLAIAYKLEFFYLRIFSAYGEGQYQGNFWPALRAAALAGEDFEMTPGGQIRDYLPVEEVANCFLNAATKDKADSGVPVLKNVGSGVPTTMKSFAQECWKNFGAKGLLKIGSLPYRENEVMRFIPDLSKSADR